MKDIFCACGRKIYKRPNSTIQSKQCPNCLMKNLLSGDADKVKNGLSKKKRQIMPKNKNSLNKQLDEAWSLLVKLRAGMICEYSGKTKYLQSHHIYSRSNFSIRWLLENGVCLNAGYHTLSSNFSAHKTPIEFIDWIKNKRGLKWLEDLRIKSNENGKLHDFEKKILLQELKKEIDKLKL